LEGFSKVFEDSRDGELFRARRTVDTTVLPRIRVGLCTGPSMEGWRGKMTGFVLRRFAVISRLVNVIPGNGQDGWFAARDIRSE
jgi:hypothetical protein